MSTTTDSSDVPAPTALVDGNHPGWASRPPADDLVPTAEQRREVVEAVDAHAAIVRSTLESHDAEEALGALEAILDLSLLEREILEKDSRRRTFALLQVQEALSKLRAVDAVAAIVDRAPRELVESCGFDRAVLFRVHEGKMMMESAYFGSDVEGADKMVAFAQSVAPPLDHMLLETDMIRRHRPAIVRDALTDPRVNRPIVDFSLTHSYVAAPIMPTGKVIGFLHADRLYSGRAVDEIDRDTVWAFAEGFGYAYERTVLLERMRSQHAEIVRALASADDAVRALQDADLDLRKVEGEPRSPAAWSLAEAQSDLAASLTRREVEVLRLMAAGRTNKQIAEDLVISTGTVKSHVKRVLRKLRVTNRAEAASTYVRLTSSPDHQ